MILGGAKEGCRSSCAFSTTVLEIHRDRRTTLPSQFSMPSTMARHNDSSEGSPEDWYHKHTQQAISTRLGASMSLFWIAFKQTSSSSLPSSSSSSSKAARTFRRRTGYARRSLRLRRDRPSAPGELSATSYLQRWWPDTLTCRAGLLDTQPISREGPRTHP